MLAYYFGRIQQWFYRLIMTIGWAIGVVYLSSFVTLTLITLYVKYLSPAIHSVEKAYPLLDTLLLPFSLVYYTGWFIGVFIVVNYVFLIWYAHVHVVNTPKPD
ncbi:MAG: hypothetical protein HWD59_03005 [Coxiellaceae bacterium]|nr:MAG: hypothetical protein HWD59_03005 [Coxiellaceae bacterium]